MKPDCLCITTDTLTCLISYIKSMGHSSKLVLNNPQLVSKQDTNHLSVSKEFTKVPVVMIAINKTEIVLYGYKEE